MADAAKEFREKKNAKKREKYQLLERFGIGIGAFLALLCVILIGWLFFGAGPKAAQGKQTVFYVETGKGAGSIASKLGKEHLIRSPFAFRVLTIITGAGKNIKPGEYEIPSHATPLKILNIIAHGEVINRKVTIPEGFTVAMTYERLKKNDNLSGDLPPMPVEGYIAPDTYQIKRGDTREMIVKQMVSAQSKIIDELWLSRAANSPLKSKEEAVILASIVEKETALAEERPIVAAVFLNRLREGMKLQSDPTIIYGITKGLPLGRKILKSEIEAKTPWNTYAIEGLPKTAICNPGKEALKAVLNPANSKAIFFVADGSGGHVFADTYEEHEKNVAKWRQFRAQQEEKEQDMQLRGAQ